MSDANVEQIVAFGFTSEQAKTALDRFGNDLNNAVNWLLEGGAESVIPSSGGRVLDASAAVPTDTGTDDAAAAQAAAVAAAGGAATLSMKCDECGFVLADEAAVQTHATRTGHTQFSESTEAPPPAKVLSPEEKAAAVEALKEKIAARKAEAAAAEAADSIEREKKRRASGKEILEAKRLREEQEIRLLAEERRREKEEERKARQRVREQIEADKARRKALRNGGTVEEEEPAPAPEPQPIIPVELPTFTEAQIQFRLSDGSSVVASFPADDTLQSAYDYVTQNTSDGASPFVLLTPFPRQEFGSDKMHLTFAEADLVPQAVLTVSKR